MVAVAIRNNMRKVLEAKGWSIRKLAKVLDKDYGYMHRIVTTDPLPDGTTLGSLVPIAVALDVSIDELVSHEPEE